VKGSRRDFIKLAGLGLASTALQIPPGQAAAQEHPTAGPERGAPRKVGGKGYNIVLLVTDQERHFTDYPPSAELVSRERLRSEGVSFENHYNCANMCTASRSVMYTGQHIQHTGMFDNTNLPWQPDMSPEIPTIGDMMRELGYYTAYKGKVHLSEALTPEANTEEKLMTDAMEPYGFSDFNATGDHYGRVLGGYTHDPGFAGDAVNWLRAKGAGLNRKGAPFFLAVNFINPHDIMYFDTDAQGEDEHPSDKHLDQTSRAPDNTLYKTVHEDFPLPPNLYQPITETGRPRAHYEYHTGWNCLFGAIPASNSHWTRYKDYYLNCLKDMDLQLATLLDELERQGMRENTVIVFTADHGEMCGAHNLRGKGPFSYEENIHVPMVIVHPEIPGGQATRAVSSHLDLAPTLLSLTGAPPEEVKRAAAALPGRDMSPVLAAPAEADVAQIRPAALHCYDMIFTLDGNFLKDVVQAHLKGEQWQRMQNIRPDLTKRGNIRVVFDGRYKFARYFAPLEHNTPRSLDELIRYNDLELFDLENDPHEMHNLAVNLEKHKELILRMNDLLNECIVREVGRDEGRGLADYEDWAVKNMRH